MTHGRPRLGAVDGNADRAKPVPQFVRNERRDKLARQRVGFASTPRVFKRQALRIPFGAIGRPERL